MKLYIGNISFTSTQEDLTDLFSQAGEVKSVNLITDRETGRPRGFGFVEFGSREMGEEAISKFDGFEFQGRRLKVNEAKAREDKPRGNNNSFGGGNRW